MEWTFKNREKASWKLINSPMKEQNAFVFFDQRRCRGSDMKLLKNAKGLITINSNLKKDDLIQACGRMRGLDYGQTLLLCGDSYTSKLILESGHILSEEIEVKHVINFCLLNIVKTIKYGFLIFASNGKHYFKKQEDLSKCPQREISNLEELYLISCEEKPISDYLIKIDNEVSEWQGKIDEYVKKYGTDEKILMINHEQEVEREKEKEIRIQREIDIEWEKFNPRKESTFKVIEFQELFYITKDLNNLNWNANIFLSENFLYPLDKINSNITYDDYLQVINYVLIESNGAIIIITDREAEEIIDNKTLENYSIKDLIHFSKLKDESFRYSNFIESLVSQIKLFSGEVTYEKEKEKQEIYSMLLLKYSVENIKNIINHRGNSEQFEKSDLDTICNDYLERKVNNSNNKINIKKAI